MCYEQGRSNRASGNTQVEDVQTPVSRLCPKNAQKDLLTESKPNSSRRRSTVTAATFSSSQRAVSRDKPAPVAGHARTPSRDSAATVLGSKTQKAPINGTRTVPSTRSQRSSGSQRGSSSGSKKNSPPGSATPSPPARTAEISTSQRASKDSRSSQATKSNPVPRSSRQNSQQQSDADPDLTEEETFSVVASPQANHVSSDKGKRPGLDKRHGAEYNIEDEYQSFIASVSFCVNSSYFIERCFDRYQSFTPSMHPAVVGHVA